MSSTNPSLAAARLGASLRVVTCAVLCAVLCALVAPAAPAYAQSVFLSWGPCDQPPLTNTTITPGHSTGANLRAYLSGMFRPTTAYSVEIWYGDASSLVPDAWRFDVAGCQGSAFITLSGVPSAAIAQACPSFRDAGGARASIESKSVDFLGPAGGSFPGSLMRVQFAMAYPQPSSGNTPDAGTTYLLLEVAFNEAYGVYGASDPSQFTCGGLEDPMCFVLAKATYRDTGGFETPLDGGIVCVTPQLCGIPVWVTANAGGGLSWEAATPVHGSTWGSLKALYRN